MTRKRLGDILIELNVLTPREVELILQAQRRRGGLGKFGQVGRSMGYLREEQILAALAVQLQLVPGAADLTLSRLLRRLTDARQTPPVLPLRPGRPRHASPSVS